LHFILVLEHNSIQCNVCEGDLRVIIECRLHHKVHNVTGLEADTLLAAALDGQLGHLSGAHGLDNVNDQGICKLKGI